MSRYLQHDPQWRKKPYIQSKELQEKNHKPIKKGQKDVNRHKKGKSKCTDIWKDAPYLSSYQENAN